MGMVVRTNTMALNAYRQLGMNTSAVTKSLEKLSSGFRINRAGDDAAGLAISEKMKAQITGLETASANAQDGISLIQTAEGNLTEVHSMLNRMVELASKSANGTYTQTERDALQAEVDSLLEEIDRISQSANFNGTRLLDGSLSEGGGGAVVAGIDRIISKKYGDDAADSTTPPADLSGERTFLDGAGTTETKTVFKVNFNGLTAAAPTGEGTKAIYESAEIKATDIKGIGTVKIGGVDVDLSTATDADKLDKIETALKADGAFNGAWDIVKGADGITITAKTAGAVAAAPAGFTETTKGVDEEAAAGTVTLTQTGDTITFDGTTVTFDAATAVGTATDTNGGNYTYTVAGDATNGWTIAITAKTPGVAGNQDFNGTVGGAAGKLSATGGVDGVKAKYDLAADDVDLNAKTLEIDGNKYNVTGATLKDQLKSWADEYNKDAANDEWEASVNADGNKIVYTAKEAGKVADTGATPPATATLVQDGDAIPDADKTKVKFDFTLNGNAVTVELDTAGGKTTAKDIAAAVLAQLGTETTVNNAKWGVADGGDGTLVFTLKDDPTTENIKGDFDWDVAATAGSFKGNHTAGTDVTTPGAIDGAATVANTVFNVTAADIKDGTKITIDGKTVTLAVGKDSVVNTAKADVVDLTHMATDNIDIDDALGRISEAFAGGTTNFIVGVNNVANGDTHQGLTVHKKDGSKETYDTMQKLADVFTLRTGGNGKPLTLQIGDTAEAFNKMTVSVDDMSTAGLGLKGLSVTTQDSASAAIDKIKTAINTVSTARAGMGALQNRLEHTINNLDVAVENLSAANSRIRDTDMAKEMMNYTKMNVLVQSAQAMLAQANQQPQSVLQLLQ